MTRVGSQCIWGRGKVYRQGSGGGGGGGGGGGRLDGAVK